MVSGERRTKNEERREGGLWQQAMGIPRSDGYRREMRKYCDFLNKSRCKRLLRQVWRTYFRTDCGHNKKGEIHTQIIQKMKNRTDYQEETDNFKQILSKLESMDKKLDRMITVKKCLNGDQLLDNQDLCLLLGVTKRTLQRYRRKEKVPFYMIDGKTYYKASEIQSIFKIYENENS